MLNLSNRSLIIASKRLQFPTSKQTTGTTSLNPTNPNISSYSNITTLYHPQQLSFCSSNKQESSSTTSSSTTTTQTLATATSNETKEEDDSTPKETKSKPKFKSNKRSSNQKGTKDSKDSKDKTKENENEKDKENKNETEKTENEDEGFNFGKLSSQFQEYTAKTFSTNDEDKESISEQAEKLKEDYEKKREEMLEAQKVSKERQETYGSKLSLFRDKNSFEPVFFNQVGYWWDYNRVKMKDWSFNLFMNGWLTQFSQRFLSYEEFTHGAIEGFSFVCKLIQCGIVVMVLMSLCRHVVMV